MASRERVALVPLVAGELDRQPERRLVVPARLEAE
jgi:hypothetical protein